MRLLYDWASESSGEPVASPLGNQAGADPMTTGATQMAAADGKPESQSTLRLDDVIPAWRAPAHKKS